MGSYRINIDTQRQTVRLIEGNEGDADTAAFVVLDDVTELQAEAIQRRVSIYLSKIKWEIPAEGFGDTVEKIAQDVKSKAAE